MNVLFLVVGTSSPGTRFRALQFFPHLEARGIHCEFRGAYGDWYNAVFARPVVGPLYKLGGRLRRAAHTMQGRDFDVVFLQRTAFHETVLPELLLARSNPRIIYDFDDSVFVRADGQADPRRRRAFHTIVRTAAHVIAGNPYLAEQAEGVGAISIIPSVIDTDIYKPRLAPADRQRLVIGWMGTAGHFPYFDVMTPAVLQILADFPHARLRIVSNGEYEPLRGHPQVEQVQWSAERELADLQSFDVGLMPLRDDAWTRGKCGFKLIQYMSVGIPTVASPVGVNRDLVRPDSGVLAASSRDWYAALRRLLSRADLRASMGAAGRGRVVRELSVSSVIDTYAGIFQSVAAVRTREGRQVVANPPVVSSPQPALELVARSKTVSAGD